MKKILAIAAIALGFAVSAAAQPRAVGGRLGYGIEASYQHCVGSPNFFEVDLGINLADLANSSFGFTAAANYNFVFAQPDWTRGTWEWYAGPGLILGRVGDIVNYKQEIAGEKISQKRWDMGFMLGVTGQVGLSYTFWFPLQLSLDIRPVIGMHVNEGWKDEAGNRYGNKCGFYNHGISYCWIPTLSVRYAF